MSLREQPETRMIQSKYVKSPNGRIFLNNPRLAAMSEMSAIDVQGFEDPVPETVEQLNAMIREGLKPKQQEVPDSADANVVDDTFNYLKANKKQIAKKAKEKFDVDLEDIDNKDVTEVRTEYELLLKTIGGTDDNTSSGSD